MGGRWTLGLYDGWCRKAAAARHEKIVISIHPKGIHDEKYFEGICFGEVVKIPGVPVPESCWNNHKYRNCQNVLDLDFSVSPAALTVRCGEKVNFTVFNNTRSNYTLLKLAGKGTLSVAPGPGSGTLEPAFPQYALAHFSDAAQKHYALQTVTYTAPRENEFEPGQTEVKYRLFATYGRGTPKSIEITVKCNPFAGTYSGTFSGGGSGATESGTFTATINSDGSVRVSGTDVLRYSDGQTQTIPFTAGGTVAASGEASFTSGEGQGICPFTFTGRFVASGDTVSGSGGYTVACGNGFTTSGRWNCTKRPSAP